MKFKLSEKFNDDMNDAINKKNNVKNRPVTQVDIDRLNDDFMQDIYEVPFDETLQKMSSRRYHYRKHVLRQSDIRRSGNRGKYDYMTIDEYYEYACAVRDLTPTHVITSELTGTAGINDVVDRFVIDGSVLKIDYNLKNKTDNHDMYAIFNKHSQHSIYMELCLVDKNTNQPISIFPLVGGRFYKYINDFVGE